MGLLKAIARLWTNWKNRRAVDIHNAANRQWTGSVAAIEAGFDMTKDEAAKKYEAWTGAAGRIKREVTRLEGKKERDENEVKECKRALNGALATIESLEGKADAESQAQLAEATEDAAQFDRDLKTAEETLAVTVEDIRRLETERKAIMAEIKQYTAKIAELDVRKARAISTFVSTDAMNQVWDELNGVRSPLDMSAIEAIEESVAQKRATVETKREIAGADIKSRRTKYAAMGDSVDSGDRVQQLLAARKAAREAATGGGSSPVKTAVKEGAPAPAGSADQRPNTNL